MQHPPAESVRRLRVLAHAYAVLVAFVFGLIVLGALVRAHGAGLACPDWPLCFGAFVPAFDLKVGFEWAHRVAAAAISLGFAVAAGLSFKLRRYRGHLLVATALLLLQILLGALTVWNLLAVWTVTAHLLVGNAFNMALLLMVLRLREELRPRARPPVRASLRVVVFVLAALGVLQIALGGLVSSSYAGLACPEWPTCNGGEWAPTWRGAVGLHLLHRSVGYILVLGLVGAACAARCAGPVGRLLIVGAGLGLAQGIVGIANVLLKLPVEVTGLHSALAALWVLVFTALLRETALAGSARHPA